MDKIKKSQVLEVLNYWKSIEFLGQMDVPKESADNKKLVENLKRGEQVKANKIEIFKPLSLEDCYIEKILEQDMDIYKDFSFINGEVTFSIGEIERTIVVEYLERFIDSKDKNPDIEYTEKSAIAWCSFKTDADGMYLPDSFQLSPVVWACSAWEKCRLHKKGDLHLNTTEYDELISQINRSLEDKNVTEFLNSLYAQIYSDYIQPCFPAYSNKDKGSIIYCRYTSEEAKDQDENVSNYGDLCQSFYVTDLCQLMLLIEQDKFGDGNEYEKQIINYILAGYKRGNAEDDLPRVIISPAESAEAMRKFFDTVLNVQRAPLGKWPAKFMPALMQQVAVNLAIAKNESISGKTNDETPIFSVNGPPGTGKTTLLKEIIASNIVERAYLLAEKGSNLEQIFEKRCFTQGPLVEQDNAYYKYARYYYAIKDDRINNYGMLVASCNNAAVENITIDLPKSKEILESLEPAADEAEDIKQGLREIQALFDIEKTEDIETIESFGKNREEKDIYFTRYANKLLGTSECWGLISAPFGKRANIKKYCRTVLTSYIEEYKTKKVRDTHRNKYEEVRTLFLKQYKLVKRLGEELTEICNLTSSIPISVQRQTIAEVLQEETRLKKECSIITQKIEQEQYKLIELEGQQPIRFSKIFNRIFKNTKTLDSLIREKKESIKALETAKEDFSNKISSTHDIIEKLKKYNDLLTKYSNGAKKMTPIDASFIDNYFFEDTDDEKLSTKAQVTNPWFTAQYNREREKLFFLACKLHKEFVIASKCMRHNIINLLIAWNQFDDCEARMTNEDRRLAMPYLLQSIFLLTPVISTTFASAQNFLGDIRESGVLGMLIIDEAGQAQPQMAVGSMFRCRKAVVVGDPKQIEPVVTAETDMIKKLFTSHVLAGYKDKTVSVQSFADYINKYGTFLGEDEEKQWIGCPLIVHRRCIDPMYTISNVLSYDSTMKQQTAPPKKKREETFILDKSYWIDVSGNEKEGVKNHFVPAQGDIVIQLLEKKFKKDTGDAIPRLFIITPFKSVKLGMIEMIRNSDFYKENEERVEKWLRDNNIGTVHTFQGQGTDEVIFLLGCDIKSVGAANWVNKNIVNVAATRAKFRLYIIGNQEVWTCKPVKLAREVINALINKDELIALLDSDMMCKNKSSDLENKDTCQGHISDKEEDMKEDIKNHDRPKGIRCPKCGKALVKRNGKYGPFLGCSGYPNCKHTQSL